MVRLPERFDVKSVQPVDLRGRPAGQRIALDHGIYGLQTKAFAPVSVLVAQ